MSITKDTLKGMGYLGLATAKLGWQATKAIAQTDICKNIVRYYNVENLHDVQRYYEKHGTLPEGTPFKISDLERRIE